MRNQNITEQTSLFKYNNKNLFSNYYLDNYLKKYPEWKEEEKLKSIFEKVKQFYSKNKSLLTSYNEAQLEKYFIQPILKILGHFFEVQEATHRIPKRPDYAFFVNEEDRKEALRNKGKEDFYKKAISVGDAKAWDVPLDRKFRGKKAYTFENPSLQIDIYLRETPPEWGILTNGKLWRIYYEKTSYKLDSYYEVNLQNIILRNDIEAFKYFYLFFRKEAFIPDATGKTFLDKVYEESVEYAKELGEGLKENIYQALRIMAQGFLDWGRNGLSPNPETLEIIRQNSLIFLYRLLFIFYAESRELLPKNHHYSLDSIKKIIADKEKESESFPTYTDDIWRKLKDFFDLINEGSESRGIPKEELYIPAYNGGLFNPDIHPFLVENSISDYHCAKVIDLLARAQTNEGGRAFVDYSTLEIRHLGSIYEGLLENKLKKAGEDLIAIKEKQSEIWVPISEIKAENQLRKGKKVTYKNKKYKIIDIANKGSVYLVTDKGERKATGSYYTPDYIVKYIVSNTLGPIIEEKKKKKGDLINGILNIKVLDPAMGSGHFLVEATDYLARVLVEALAEEEREYEEEEIRIARREVVERCIFGVDLNPLAVELAKLSLWLSTVSTNNALSFLDHHLKCGNSLIGAKIEDLGQLPDLKKSKKKKEKTMGIFEPEFMKRVGNFLKVFEKIEKMPSETAEQVKEKTRIYNEEFERKSIPFKTIANLWLSNYFGNEVPFSEYSELQLALTDETSELWKKYSDKKWFKKALKIAEEKHFFHWELEFPEVFFEKGKKGENPGFDAVIGNPPYERTKYLIEDQSVYNEFYETAYGAYDIYILFMEKSLSLLLSSGYFSFIVSNKFVIDDYGAKLRNLLTGKYYVHQLIDLTECPSVFKEALVSPLVIIASRSKINFVNIAVFKQDMPEKILDLPSLFTLNKHTTESDFVVVERRRINELQHPDTGHFNVYLVGHKRLLERKLYTTSLLLKELLTTRTGIMGFEYWSFEPFVADGRKTSSITSYFKLLTPSLLERYQILWELKPVDIYKKRFYRPILIYKESPLNDATRKFFKSQKIVVRGTARKLTASFDIEGHALLVAVHGIECKDLKKGFFLLSLLNSSLLNWLHIVSFYSARIPQGSLRYPVSFYDNLPIRRISFVTPKAKRDKLLQEAKKLYKEYIDTGKYNTILQFVEDRLKKSYKPDPNLVNNHNSHPLNKNWQIRKADMWEHSDVVYDMLVFLAEEMTRKNKEKNKEIKGFLSWLKSHLKIQSDNKGKEGLDILKGYNRINYYMSDYMKQEKCLSFDEFWEFLEKNKNRIKANLKSRELYEAIKTEYEKSLSKLIPIKEKLHKTDWLIDQIVYRLYGLTDEEIKLVEESVPSEK